MSGIVIIGGGQAGVQLVDSLRSSGYEGQITLFADEVHLPYQRPPLSKDFMAQESVGDVLPLRAEKFFTEHDVDFRRGTTIVSIDRAAHTVTDANGELTGYERLVLATGARNRLLQLDGVDLRGIHYLRTLDDAVGLQRDLNSAQRAVVVGAGFIGLEFAAGARKRGLDVTVLEFADRPMARVLSQEMSAYFTNAHTTSGVDLRFGEGVVSFEGSDGIVTGVVGSSGERYPADLVLIGAGVVPNVELAAEAGLATDNGIVVSSRLQTDDPDIFALGDCARYPSTHGRGPTRLESVQNATDHARSLAAVLMGHESDYESLPWFWSQQGDLKLQIAGLSEPEDQRIGRGDPDGVFAVYSFRDGALVAVESVNSPAEHMAARRILGRGLTLSPEQLADPAFDIKSYSKAS